jgi:hypothetical protein
LNLYTPGTAPKQRQAVPHLIHGRFGTEFRLDSAPVYKIHLFPRVRTVAIYIYLFFETLFN